MLQSTAAASERVFEFLEEEEEEPSPESPVSTENLEGRVEFDHVHFGYNPDHIIINDLMPSRAGTEDRHCGTDRSRKDDDDKTSDAVL